jgi:uncharacterized repeat protein (TIGR01451 family)
MKTTTKLFYGAWLLLILAIGKANAQMVYLPDYNFRNALIAKGYGSAIVGDSLNAGDSLVINTIYLVVSSKGISNLTGIEAFINLDYLDCKSNQLTTLPQLPSTLNFLDCYDNMLTSLPQLPTALTFLNCSYNNQLTFLPQLPLTLETLYCAHCQLATLPLLPLTLETLVCDHNLLATLPQLTAALSRLDCSFNLLTYLPQLPSSLSNLNCATNLLTSLPNLPSSLTVLVCRENNLTVLPVLPLDLVSLICRNNLLTALPNLPPILKHLHCSYNQLIALPPLPVSLKTLRCDGNNNLSCLPKLHDMSNLTFDSTAITCIPNYATISYSLPLISTIPICDQFNTNGCEYYWNIAGQTDLDQNANCVYDTATDAHLKNIPLQLFSIGNLLQQTTTNYYGKYNFDTDSLGIYEVRIDTTDLPFDVICPGTNLYTDTITPTDSIKTGRDFSFQCKGDLHVGIKSIYGRFVTGQLSTIKINAEDLAQFYGMNCASGESGIVTTTLNGPVTYMSPAAGSLTPTTVSGNILTYNVADFGALTSGAFDVVVKTDTTAQAGTPVCVTVTTNTTNISGNIKMDSLQQCFVVVNSYDPNDKQVSPVNGIDINGDGWLIYTINFQNTGTAEAFNIYLLDTLDNNLDWSTFKLTAYSHEPQIQLFNTGVLRFNFPNINLPDSNTNEPLSHGYVQYKVKLKQGLSLGTQIRNTAYIYFDFNSPVVTNTTQNVLVVPIAIDELNNQIPFHIAPNPVHSVLYIMLSNNLPSNTFITINDMQGRIIKQISPLQGRGAGGEAIDVNALTQGVYLLRINGQVQRFVKL